MLRFSAGTRQQLPPLLFEKIGHYRREVFINRLGWELNTVNGMELDEFDGPDAVYVCSHDDDGNVNGVARLLPTTGSYLMEKVFPQLWSGKTLPRDQTIWELSRFAATHSSHPQTLKQVESNTAPDLLSQVMKVAECNGAHTLITVSPVGIERLLRVNRFFAKRIGTPMRHGTTSIAALVIGIKDARGSDILNYQNETHAHVYRNMRRNYAKEIEFQVETRRGIE